MTRLADLLSHKKVFRYRDLADALDLPISVIREWDRRGQLPPPVAHVNRKNKLFARADLIAWLEKATALNGGAA
jgi:DNA-binding transcriptional MerR regulator